MPVFLLGSAIYLGLRLTQMKLSHEKYVVDAESRIQALEAEIAGLEKSGPEPQVTVTSGSQTPPSKPSRWGLW
ncbi:hypothetical protein CC1G_01264 [Coprinopsis cinerea okayama7|uniref:Uncharacterized protein n=1 Tax=Coprinopsis cinerea (strain Okayama-7 / 130 / ATCC MYA-4618 / FGSC 9003) TaxID=240176 RepID=A8NY61_COPC7|nr:hypothetical protein CC1G_01264 [Coprinopsis cinerea okayama7\|eukprot:XP_001837352.2 hypothetical protein CC1G_01264 [Coprinopsis cinerea okayama7\